MICNKCGKPFTRRLKSVRFIDWCDGCNGKWFSMSEGHPEGVEFVNVSDIFLQKQYKKVRHEICEKIRNWLKSRATKYIVGKKFVYEFLDQIEQGEEELEDERN